MIDFADPEITITNHSDPAILGFRAVQPNSTANSAN